MLDKIFNEDNENFDPKLFQSRGNREKLICYVAEIMKQPIPDQLEAVIGILALNGGDRFSSDQNTALVLMAGVLENIKNALEVPQNTLKPQI